MVFTFLAFLTVSLTSDVQLRKLIVLVLEHLIELFSARLAILVILVYQKRAQNELIKPLQVVSASFSSCLALDVIVVFWIVSIAVLFVVGASMLREALVVVDQRLADL